MSSRSLLGRSVASFTSLSRPPQSFGVPTSVNCNRERFSLGATRAVAFQAPPRAAVLYSLPLRTIWTPRRAMSQAELKAEPKATAAVSPIVENLESVRTRVMDAAVERESEVFPRLVAVSKTKPLEDLLVAYEAGQRIFGENYVQELIDKSPNMPDDAVFHFIGHLQSNKAKALVAGVPNLAVVETLDSTKLSNKLQSACEAAGRRSRLGVFLQIDTSGEAAKSGVSHDDMDAIVSLSRHVVDNCPALGLQGLMTIGAPGDMKCFDRLRICRDGVAEGLAVEPQELGLSMGMSGDFEEAIRRGSTNVRVGSTIFGARYYPDKA